MKRSQGIKRSPGMKRAPAARRPFVTTVEDPSRFGVVVSDAAKGGVVTGFVEKPTTYVGNNINAGMCANPAVTIQRGNGKTMGFWRSAEGVQAPSEGSDQTFPTFR